MGVSWADLVALLPLSPCHALTCSLATAPTCDGPLAAAALGRKEFSKTGHTVGIVIPRCELLSRQGCLAPSTDQAFSMPGLISVRHSTLGQRLWGHQPSAGESVFPPTTGLPLNSQAQPPPCCSGHTEEQTCSHSKARSSERPCRARRSGSLEAAHTHCTESNAHATSGLHTPASGTLWETGIPFRVFVPSS